MNTNIQESDILIALSDKQFTSQRAIAEHTGYSLGAVNQSLKSLNDLGYITDDNKITDKAKKTLKSNSPKNAIILAAGFGMRMVPINHITPKAFLEVKGEYLIERQISQLGEAGITDITIVVGYMKESFDYLIDKYNVNLIVNPEYSSRNNLHSLALASHRLGNTYIVPCDMWAKTNPFSTKELYSWYMLTDDSTSDSGVRVNRKKEIVRTNTKSSGNSMIGIAYVTKEVAKDLKAALAQMDSDPRYDNQYWEEALFQQDKDRMSISAKVIPQGDIIEINTYEQLRALDDNSGSTDSDVLKTIASALNCKEEDITNITILKKGMTNRSFIFTANNNKYIMRIPGEGTDKLINRTQEAAVYKAIEGKRFCDEPVYINPDNGYKITKYLDDVRVCDPENEEDITKCMAKLKAFHNTKIKVDHTFDIFGQIQFYEDLMGDIKSGYRDYEQTKANVMELKKFIDGQKIEKSLTHIDAVPDNFLFYADKKTGREELQLTDWEYSGMQDPYVDLAMFSIYSYYTKEQIDHLIDIYFDNKCSKAIRARIYCYVASCGLLWSNWTEYKSTLGVEFGEYGLRQYRYAKEFYTYAQEVMKSL